MTEVRFWQLCLWFLPLASAAGIAIILLPLAFFIFEHVYPLILTLIYALMLGCIPYLIAVLLASLYLRAKPAAFWARTALIFPAALAVLIFPLVFVAESAWVYYASWVLGTGYAQVVLAFGLRWVLRRAGIIVLAPVEKKPRD